LHFEVADVVSGDGPLPAVDLVLLRDTLMHLPLTDALRVLREIKLMRHLGRHENLVELVSLEEPPGGISLFSDVYICTKLWETDLHRVI